MWLKPGGGSVAVMEAVAALGWLWVPLVVWGVVEAADRRRWWWVATIVLLFPSGAMAWFIAGRRWYPTPRTARPDRRHVDGSVEQR
jgi:hypothetical protein